MDPLLSFESAGRESKVKYVLKIARAIEHTINIRISAHPWMGILKKAPTLK